MKRRFPKSLRQFIKATQFWQDNALILREFQHFRHIVLLALLFPVLAGGFEGFSLSFLLAFLQNLVNSAEPFRTGWEWFDISVLGINESDFIQLCRVSGLILISIWLRALCNYFTQFYMRLAQVKLTDRINKQIFEQLQALSLKFYSEVQGGEILNTLTAEVMQLQMSVGVYSFFISKGTVLLVYSTIACWISFPLTIITILLFTITAVGLSNLNKRIREASFLVSLARGRFTSLAGEFINGIRTIQAFATQDFERQRFYQASEEVVAAATIVSKRAVLTRPLAEGLASTILIGIIIAGMGILVTNGSLEVASLLTFVFVLFRLVPAIQELTGKLSDLSRFQGSVDNIKRLLATDNKPYIPSGHRQFDGLKRSIEFIDVDFGYDPDTPVLKDITLTIENSKTTALVGSSGAGKSTLADLIARFYDPTNGQILIDGVDLRELDIHSIRRRMAIVSQRTFIFNTSVRNNIAYGSENVTDADIWEAARLANAKDFIEDLEAGFDTILGDRGVRLSGGQCQRIAIARALLRNPEILILDEATSALDSVSERLIQESLEKLSVGRTVIVIAHRLSTIANSDKVIVLEQGNIVEQGTYKHLLSLRGKLWNYHKIQGEAAVLSN